MAQAITFIVMGANRSHAAQDSKGVYLPGDIIDADLTANVPEDPHPNSPFIFIDVSDVPNAAALRVKKIRDADFDDVETNPDRDIVRRRTFYLDRTLIPAARRAALLAARRGSATWAEFKGIVKKRATEINIDDADFN